MVTYYEDGHGGYIAITSRCPKGFDGIVFVGKGPRPNCGVDSIQEQGFSASQIKCLTPAKTVPDEWLLALGYDKPKPKPVAVERQVIDVSWWPFSDEPIILPRLATPEELRRQNQAKNVGLLATLAVVIIYVAFQAFGR